MRPKANSSPNILLMAEARAPVSLRVQPPEHLDDFGLEALTSETRLWDLHPSLHCSIIGTCLTAAELRQILKRAGLEGIEGSCDNDLHSIAVGLCSEAQPGSKFLNKALNRKHRVIIKKFAAAKTAGELKELWQEFLNKGEVPGAYWALLTHPSSDETVAKKAFGDVHMLSHLMGASNRADIRRLRQLEAENNALVEKMERQARRLRESLSGRDRKITELTANLSEIRASQVTADAIIAKTGDPAESDLIAALDGKLKKQAAHASQLERRLSETKKDAALAKAGRTQLLQQVADLKTEIAALEALISSGTPDSGAAEIHLGGKTLLYVGGRPHHMPQFKKIAEDAGAYFLHHDGGVEESSNSLAALAARADAILFPVDCVSHRAVTVVKRICSQLSKDYLPMRSSGLSSFAGAVHRLGCRKDKLECQPGGDPDADEAA